MRVPILPPPGLNSMGDTGHEAPGVWRTGSNVRFFQGVAQTIGGSITLQSAALETYTWVSKLLAYKVAGVVNIAIATTNSPIKLWRVNTTTWARTDITPASPDWSVAGTRFSLEMFGDILLTCASGGTLHSSTAGAQAVAIANAPDVITRMIVTPSRQVMALGCNEEVSGTFNGRCIRWSDIEDHTDWTTLSSNNAGEYILPGQESIVGGCVLGDHIIVWTSGSIWLGQYIGQPGQTFIFTRVGEPGIIGHDAYAILRGVVYWLDPSFQLHAYAPGQLPQKVPCPVVEDVIAEADRPDNGQINGLAVRRFGEVWFFYAASWPTPNKYFAYCVDESEKAQRPVWFTGSLGVGAAIDDPLLIGALNVNDSTVVTISSDNSSPLKSIDQQGPSSSISIPAFEIETTPYYLDEGQRRVMLKRYIGDMAGNPGAVTLTVTGRRYPEDSTSTEALSIGGTTVKSDFRYNAHMISVKFAGAGGSGSNFSVARLGKPAFDVVVLGDR